MANKHNLFQEFTIHGQRITLDRTENNGVALKLYVDGELRDSHWAPNGFGNRDWGTAIRAGVLNGSREKRILEVQVKVLGIFKSKYAWRFVFDGEVVSK
jgi:hypothetical protein